jgi:survival-of-motor-neuron-related-splicing factor 30
MEPFIAMHEATLARLRPELANLEAQLPQAPQPAAPKFDPEKHPLLRKVAEKQEPEKPVTFSTGDMVEAQWTDRSWYKAKVQSVLGSASAPKYLVRFIEYEDSITVDRNAVRPLPSKRKRDPEPAAAPSPAIPVTSTPHVISGPASVNPNAPQANKNIGGEEDVKSKSRIANKGQLKKRQGAWQEFQAKTSKKIPKKESMFRTSTEAGSRGKRLIHIRLPGLLLSLLQLASPGLARA